MSDPRPTWTRRAALQAGAALPFAGLACAHEAKPAAPPRNIILVVSDQHSGTLLSGDQLLTPGLDRLRAEGLNFTRACCTETTCCPARSALLSGRMASETGVVRNGKPMLPNIPDLGAWLKEKSGVEPFYAGKWHIPQRVVWQSFNWLSGPTGMGESCDLTTLRTASSFLAQRKPTDPPFFLVVSFLQPHDIGEWNMTEFRGIPVDPVSDPALLPELPPTWDFEGPEPAAIIQFLRRRFAGGKWPEDRWRRYLWGYHRLVEALDATMGRFLENLDASPHAADTLLLYTADHGEGMADHGLVQKGSCYEPVARVPMLARWPGHVPAGKEVDPLVQQVDLTATITDMLGVPPLPQQRGMSLRPWLEGQTPTWREHMVIEALVDGRVIYTDEHKLISFRGDPVENLFNLRTDPFEEHDLAREPASAALLADLHEKIETWEKDLVRSPASLEGFQASYGEPMPGSPKRAPTEEDDDEDEVDEDE